MRKDQYILKSNFKPTMTLSPCSKGINKIDLYENRDIDEEGRP